MSKTVDDLIGVYIEASNAVVWEAEKRGLCPMTLDMQRAGIAAVVRALRDEFTKLGTLEFQDGWTVLKKFDEILGDAGDEVADTVAQVVEPLEVREVTGASPVRTATDPAPAVCVWRVRNKHTLYVMPCDKAHRVGLTEEWKDLEDCPHCGLPIKFTEAK